MNNTVNFLERKDNFIQKYNYGKNIVDLGEYVVRLYSGCFLKCKYCYVREKPTIYTNLYKLEEELKLLCNTNRKIYLNAGENADSFLFNKFINSTSFLLSLTKKYKNTYAELRTKISDVSMLFSSDAPKDRTIVCFSILPEKIRRIYEPLTAPIEERIKALSDCVKEGFRVGIRFEPIIKIDKLRNEYEEIIKEISKVVSPTKIHSIGFGVIRFTKELIKDILKDKITKKLLHEEIFKCPDGKYRYFRTIRVKIYKTLIELSKKYFQRVPIFLSTEFEYIWQDCGLKIFKLDEI